MKKTPKKIYLQVDPEGEKPSGDYYDDDQITWCEDRMNESDIEYVKTSLFEKVEKQISEKEILKFGFQKTDNQYELPISNEDENCGFGAMKIIVSPHQMTNFSLLLCEGQKLNLQLNSLEQLRVFIDSIHGYEPVW